MIHPTINPKNTPERANTKWSFLIVVSIEV
jgi:hypothetical protein